MTTKELLELLEKFENGTCTNTEQERLFGFYESFQNKNLIKSINNTELEQIRLNVLSRINKSIKYDKPRNRFTTNYFRYASIAALFFLFFGLGLVWTYRTNSKQIVVENAITLQLEDGSIQVLDDQAEFSVINHEGETIGNQKGNQLVYTSNPNSTKLLYNTINVPYGKTFNLQLSDGTKVKLNSGSSLKYPVQFLKNKDRQVFVVGEAFLEVAKDIQHPFIVNANELNIRVLGTQFNVHAYPEDMVSEVVLVEGAVGLYSKDEMYSMETSTRLFPGYMASFSKTSKNITKKEVITDVYTSWMTGELVFRDMYFENILKKLERHFNVEIINTNPGLSKQKFQASFGKDPDMHEVLKELNMVYGIEFTINDNVITIK